MASALTPLAFDDLAPPLREALRSRYERLGYLGGFFGHMAHQPEALAAFDAYTEACKRALPRELAETVALTVATALGNEYERVQHEHLALRSGARADWVRAVERLRPADSTDLTDDERLVQRFALAAVGGLTDPQADIDASATRLDELVEALGAATAAAVALLTGRFVAHAIISRACRLQPPVARAEVLS